MRGFFIRWAIYTLALMLVAEIIPGISVDSWQTTIVAALALGLANAFLRPILILFTLPLNILSLGVFTLLINAFLFYGVSRLVSGFTISGFRDAFLGSLVLSIISFTFNCIIRPNGAVDVHWAGSSSCGHARRERRDSRIIDIESEPDDDKKEGRQ